MGEAYTSMLLGSGWREVPLPALRCRIGWVASVPAVERRRAGAAALQVSGKTSFPCDCIQATTSGQLHRGAASGSSLTRGRARPPDHGAATTPGRHDDNMHPLASATLLRARPHDIIMSQSSTRIDECRSGGTGRRKGLKIPRALGPCGFDPRLRHQAFETLGNRRFPEPKEIHIIRSWPIAFETRAASADGTQGKTMRSGPSPPLPPWASGTTYPSSWSTCFRALRPDAARLNLDARFLLNEGLKLLVEVRQFLGVLLCCFHESLYVLLSRRSALARAACAISGPQTPPVCP